MKSDDHLPPKNSSSARDGSIDWSVLDELKALQKPGAPDLCIRLMTIYLKSSHPLMEKIRTAINFSDSQLLMTAAHTLKSTSLSVGALKLGAICAELEQIGRDNALQKVGDLPEQAEEQYEAVISSFKEIVQQSGSQLTKQTPEENAAQ